MGFEDGVVGTATIIVEAFDGGDESIEISFDISVIDSTNNEDLLVGENGNNYLAGLGGSDTLEGNDGDDTLNGDGGDDILFAHAGNDLLAGGSGSDTLEGGSGNDTYSYSWGFGADVIEDYDYSAGIISDGGNNDTLRFESGITRDNLRWNFAGDDLIFTLTDSSSDRLTILNYSDSRYVIENIEVDGSLLTSSEILNPIWNQEYTTIGEFGQVNNFDHHSQTIEFSNNYLNPVVFALPLSRNGGDPGVVRITDIESNSFTAYLQEAEYKDGWHIEESFSYLVLEAGDWVLEDGTMLEVGTVDTNKLTTQGWENLSFDLDFEETPTILSQVQTDNGNQFVRTRQRGASLEGFLLSMEEEETLKYSGHSTETVGWLAIESGQGNWGELQYQAGHTVNVVDHRGYSLNFDVNFDSEPLLLASLASFNGGDSAGLRYRSLDNTQVEIMIEEDQSLDSETIDAPPHK